jgi:hypothetical protein
MTHRLRKVLSLFVFGVILMVVEPTNLPDSFFPEADARVGRPLTPVSVAGVVRRTARRTVYATAVYVAPTTTTVVMSDDNSYEDQQTAYAQQEAAQAEQDAAMAQQEAAKSQQQQSTLPIGATLPSLPAGCASITVKNQSYFSCGTYWFRPAMQNGNIVHAVVADPNE